MKLRPYQSQAVELTRQSMQHNKRIIVCLPTGGGKSAIFSHIAKSALEKGKQVLILTHRKELLAQAKSYGSGCVVAMVEKVYNRIKKGTFTPNEMDLIIVDECHVNSFTKILNHYHGFVLGFTATPIAKPPLNETYNDIVSNVDIPMLVDQGFLASPKTFVKTNVDVSQLQIKGKDFSEVSLNNVYNKPKTYIGVVEDYMLKFNRKKAICFCVNIEHTLNTHHQFITHGVEAYYIDSNMPDYERDTNIAKFKTSKYGVLVNCGIATTGFDVPDIEVVIVNRATMSLALWLQMCGRGSRPTPTKKEFTILDYGDNVKRLGHWEAERDWVAIFNSKPKKAKELQMPAPTKICPKCEAMIFASARVCKHCEYIFELGSKAEGGDLQEFTYVPLKKVYDLSLSEILDLQKKRKYKQHFVEHLLYSTRNKHGDRLTTFWDEKGYGEGYRVRRIEQMSSSFPVKNFVVK